MRTFEVVAILDEMGVMQEGLTRKTYGRDPFEDYTKLLRLFVDEAETVEPMPKHDMLSDALNNLHRLLTRGENKCLDRFRHFNRGYCVDCERMVDDVVIRP